jgi:hypothetical protein
MSRGNKNQHMREITEAQTAKVPSKNTSNSPKFNVEECLLFKSANISKEEIANYLDFCRKIFPCNNSKLGSIFTEDINVQSALEILHKYNYDIPTAKFHLTFPSLSRYSQFRNINLDSSIDYKSLVDDFSQQKAVVFTSHEKSIFDDLNNRVSENKNRIPYADIETLVQEGVKKRYTFPEPLRTELEKTEAMNTEITQILADQKPFSIIQVLFIKCNKLKIIPKAFDLLSNVKSTCDDIMSRVNEFIKSKEKDIKNMHKITEDIKSIKLMTKGEHSLLQFEEFSNMSCNILKKVQILSKPYRGKEFGPKFKLTDVFDIMEYFHKYSIKNEKSISEVAYNVYRIEIEKENCLMFLEDPKETDAKNFINFVDDLKKCALDYDKQVSLVESKINALEIYKPLLKNIYKESLIDENLKKIESFEKLKSPFFKKNVGEMKSSLLILKTIEAKVSNLDRNKNLISEFLFGSTTLIDVDEIFALLNQLKAKDAGFMEISFIQKVLNGVIQFETETHSSDLAQCDNLKVLIERVKHILTFGFQNKILQPFLKDKILDSLEIEYYIFKLLEKFTFEKVFFEFEEFESAVRMRVKNIQSFENGAELAMTEIDKLLNPALKEAFFKCYSMREDIKLRLEENPAESTDDALIELEKTIRENFKDKEILKRLKTN